MGIDLKLIPFEEGSNDIEANAIIILPIFRRGELRLQIEAIKSFPIPKFFDSDLSQVDANGYHTLSLDGRGNPLKCVYVKDLKSLTSHQGVQDNYYNRAIWAYLNELPDETKVALYFW